MGLNLIYVLVSSLLISGCLNKGNFGQKAQQITEEADDDDEGVTSSTFTFSNISVSPENSFNPIFSARLVGNLSQVSKVLLYTVKSGSTCSSPVTYNDGRHPANGIGVDEFNGNILSAELSLIALPANTYINIYAVIEKTSGTNTSCVYLTRYKHNLQSPITLTKALVDGQEYTSSPSHFKATSLTLKLAADVAEVDSIKLYKNSCDTSEIAEGAPSTFEAGVVINALDISLNQQNRFFARGYNGVSSVTGCVPVFSANHDNQPPTLPATISHSAISRSLTSTPAMTWAASTDVGSGVNRYEYAIGTQDNNNSVRDWTTATSNNNFIAGQSGQAPSLSFAVGVYYFKLRAVDNVGNVTAERSTSWRVIDEDTELAIVHPPATSPHFVVSSRDLTVFGTCISGVDVVLEPSTGVTGPESVTCASDNTFNYPLILTLPSAGYTSVNRTISISQDNGLGEDNVSRTVELSPLIATGSTVAAGSLHSCTLNNSRAYCTGANSNGQLGNGTTTAITTPHALAQGGSTFSFDQISAGVLHACTLRANKVATCWGSNSEKQIGQGTGNYFTTQQVIASNNTPVSFLQISAGGYHTCGVLWNKEVWCWGDNSNRQLGNSLTNTADSRYVVKVELPSPAVHISAGGYFTCALLENKDIYCWGRALGGELGFNYNPIPANSAEPKKVENPLDGNEHYTDVSAGSRHACATTNTGRAFCWGRNDAGALGYGSVLANAVPIPTTLRKVAGNHSFKRVFAGGDPISNTAQVSCGIRSNDNALYCWGNNSKGQLGIGHTTNQSSPVAVNLPATEKAFDVDIGSYHTCARTKNTTTNAISTYCWGEQNSGRLGNGQSGTASITTPVKITTFSQ